MSVIKNNESTRSHMVYVLLWCRLRSVDSYWEVAEDFFVTNIYRTVSRFDSRFKGFVVKTLYMHEYTFYIINYIFRAKSFVKWHEIYQALSMPIFYLAHCQFCRIIVEKISKLLENTGRYTIVILAFIELNRYLWIFRSLTIQTRQNVLLFLNTVWKEHAVAAIFLISQRSCQCDHY